MSTGSVNGLRVGVVGSVGVNTARVGVWGASVAVGVGVKAARVGVGGASVASGGAVRVQADKNIATTNKRPLIRLMSSPFVEAGKLLTI